MLSFNMSRSMLTRIVDTLKLYTKAHGAKVRQASCSERRTDNSRPLQTTNLIINLDHDEWILDDDSKVLADYGIGTYNSPPTAGGDREK